MTTHDDIAGRRIANTITAYYAATRAMDLEAWVSAFAPDAVVFNPAGAAPITGHQGVRELWASVAGALDRMGLSAERVFVAGSRAAVKWTGQGVGWNGRRVVFEGIDIFEFGHDGKVHALWSYWDPTALRGQLHAGS